MLAPTKTYRYQLPKKAVKTDCPQCGNSHRSTLSRFIDNESGELLPEEYGRCDRESNCGYYLSPYHKGGNGTCYADDQKQPSIPSEWFKLAGKCKRNGLTKAGANDMLQTMVGATSDQADRVIGYVFSTPTQITPTPVYSLPDEIFKLSLNHYGRNQFARLLSQQFGMTVAHELLQRFQIGTSSRWPGACVFWYVDEKGRKRGGQIKLFGTDWHTAKYIDSKGEKRSKTSWVHSALISRYNAAKTPVPDWLTEYDEKGESSPCLFGLPQLLTAPIDKPVAIVEAPKTAVVCTHYFPGFVWLAVGGLSYLTTNTDTGLARLTPLRGRKIMLFPDLNGFAKWSRVAEDLNKRGYCVEVSAYLEQIATDEQKTDGLDLADFVLTTPPTCSGSWPPPGSVPEFLSVERYDNYPPEWDAP